MGPSQKKGKSKLVSHQQPHDDEGWLVSYADMITLLMGFFVILYSFSSIDPKKFSKVTDEMSEALTGEERKTEAVDKNEINQETLHYLTQMVSGLGMGSAAEVVEKMKNDDSKNAMLDEAKRRLEDEGFSESDDNYLEYIIPAKFIFSAGSAVLTSDSKKGLEKVLAKIKKIQDLVEVVVEGHTDSVPVSKTVFLSNWGLSSARAGSVAQFLEENGVAAENIRPVGFGSSKPLFPETGVNGKTLRKNRDLNRRVHIVLKKKSGEL